MTTYQEQALAYLKGEMNAEERAMFEETLAESEELQAELENSRALLDLLTAANEEAVVKQVHQCIQQAIQARASDIHLVGLRAEERADERGAMQPDSVQISFRVDGYLQEWKRLRKAQQQAIVDRWKVMAEMNVAERRLPQDGRISVRYEGKHYELRVSVLPTATGERVTARIIDRNNVLIGLDRLGLSGVQQAAIRRMLDRTRGMVMVGGFEGNGKTTLLYSMLTAVNEAGRPARNLLTVEDPVEYLLPGVSQTQVNRAAGLTWAAALRSIFRADPDVVYLAQMRSLECAELSVELALTGQLVLSQLHVSSALQVVQRLREMGIENFLIGYVLLGSVGVRLVRRVCPECVEEYLPASEQLDKSGLSPVEDGPFRHGAGCTACRGTGYSGRIGLFEVLETDESVLRMIIDRAPLDAIWQATFGRRGGSLWDDAREKIRQGLTTVEEANSALSDYPHPRNGVDAGLQAMVELG